MPADPTEFDILRIVDTNASPVGDLDVSVDSGTVSAVGGAGLNFTLRGSDGFQGVILETPNALIQFIVDTEEGFVARIDSSLGIGLLCGDAQILMNGGRITLSNQLYEGSGTTTDSLETIIESPARSNLQGSYAVKNTDGSNDLTVHEVITDAWGNVATNDYDVTPGNFHSRSVFPETALGLIPPAISLSVQIISKVAGMSATYDFKFGLTF